MKVNKIPIFFSITMLFLAVFPIWPYGYYTILRIIVCGVSCYICFVEKENNRPSWMWYSGFVAVLFNPLIPIQLEKMHWGFIDIGVAISFIVLMVQDKKRGKASKL